MAQEVVLTQEGFDEMTVRLDYLLNVERNAVAGRIKIAREYGDLSENAEYDAAKDEQKFIELEIKELQDKLSNCKIINEETLNKRVVNLGSTVKIYDLELEEEFTYKIVGSTEVNVTDNKISNESPLGMALLGKRKNAEVEIVAPIGTYKVKVISINI